MLTNLLIDSFLFWFFSLTLIVSAIYITKVAIRMFEYEKQVDRSWNDLLDRADKMIKRLDETLHEIEKMKDEREKHQKNVGK